MRWVKKPIAAQMKRAQTNMTYVVDGNKCANIVPQGQYFQLINSAIAGRSDGVYTASKAIPANEVIDNTYFNQTSPIAEGAINKINSELTSLNSNTITKSLLRKMTITGTTNKVGAFSTWLSASDETLVSVYVTNDTSGSYTVLPIFLSNGSIYVSIYRASDMSAMANQEFSVTVVYLRLTGTDA